MELFVKRWHWYLAFHGFETRLLLPLPLLLFILYYKVKVFSNSARLHVWATFIYSSYVCKFNFHLGQLQFSERPDCDWRIVLVYRSVSHGQQGCGHTGRENYGCIWTERRLNFWSVAKRTGRHSWTVTPS